jgi:hypothetical protein
MHVGNPLTLAKSTHLSTDRGDHACCFASQHTRQGHGVQPRAIVNVDVVQADGRVTHLNFIWRGWPGIHTLQRKDFRTTVLMQANGVRHGAVIPFRLTRDAPANHKVAPRS